MTASNIHRTILPKQALILKVAAVCVAAPRWAGAFALASGADLSKYDWLISAEVISAFAMALLEGFAIAYILSKWRLLQPRSVGWWALLLVVLLLALSLPLVALPYLTYAQIGAVGLAMSSAARIGWNFLISAVPMLIIIGVGLADVDEQERSKRQLEAQHNQALYALDLEQVRSKRELEIELAKMQAELQIKQARAQHKQAVKQIDANELSYICEHCRQPFGSAKALNGHKAHCRVNGKTVELVGVL